MRSYVVQAGDTYETISRRVYGTDRHSGLIAAANPSGLAPGTTISIPELSGAPGALAGATPAQTPNEVALSIGGRRFRFWTNIRIRRSIDSLDTVTVSAPFAAEREEFRQAVRPFSYAPLAVSVGGARLFTGTMVAVDPEITPAQKTVQISGYATPGVLGDCTMPASAYPTNEFNEQALPEIANTLCAPFGIETVFTADGGAAFARVAIEPGKPVLSFLTELAQQRGLIVTSNPAGALVFQKSLPAGVPAAVLSQGQRPLVSVVPSFSPQQYYSHITGLETVLIGTNGSQYTVQNPRLTAALRPVTFRVPDIIAGDLKQAVEAKMGRMFANAASYSVSVSTWRDANGELWSPNTTIKLLAPDAMIYSPYAFTVRSVVFEKAGDSESALLELVIPGAFSGEIPEALPWD